MNDDDDWTDAWRFAAEHHHGQTLPGSELSYLTHLGSVVLELLAAHVVEPVPDIELAVPCAILHDCIEDQGVTHAELASRFGVRVADGVAALSKDPALPKAEAMTDSLSRIQAQPKAVWCVKLADRISNLGPPPAHWDAAKRRAYREEARLILNRLGAAHSGLAARLRTRIEGYDA